MLRGAIALLRAMESKAEPADRTLFGWMKANHRRFDARERSALVQMAMDALRQRARLQWWLSRAGIAEADQDAGLRIAALKILQDGSKPDGMREMLELGEESDFDKALRRLGGHTLEHPEMPLAVRFNIPDWIEPRFTERFGADLELELAAMLRPAPLDLRVNTLKTTREAALAALTAEQQRVQPTPLSPVGLRLGPNAYVNDGAAYGEGLVEPQDEGSQIAALLVEAAGCKMVVDFCAGAGGKSLAIGAAMGNVGRLVACDVSEKRLARAKLRLRRAGVHNAECRVLEAKWLKRHAGKADRVLVDAPCSGTGTWRRKPDARWRLTESDVQELRAKQAEILDRAAKLVVPGGRLIYVTCSVLTEENEDQITAFRQRHSDFRILPVPGIWARSVGGGCPTHLPTLRLSPGRNGTDGFFVAVLEKF
ncbi:RsmB/NOP family class I SAM-dependent RNA methyltransferase [Ferrovibrio sp.]|uniref:RsmB/NOP family class I SAM-dependent RNA methyltransferase n=1 Tax=Ferrovibrio sp. TaxID=1917215 RepID=UPI0025BE1217|nr:RsmB/NOP family class I SAM-dependent RNA methyltransferase [Ferrovibrio sp.]